MNAPTLGVTAVTALVPDGSAAGYQVRPGVLAADGSFTIPDVPAGTYFLQITATDPLFGTSTQLTEVTTSTPLITRLTSARPDVAVPAAFTPVTLGLSGLDPWTPDKDLLQISSSQAGVSKQPYGPYEKPLTPPPALGATSYTGTIDWTISDVGASADGLPDASKGDVVFVHQAPPGTVGSGAALAVTSHATRFARLADVTVVDGAASTLAAVLGPAAQTGSMRADVKTSKFAALAADVGTGASLEELSIVVFGAAHSAAYPMSFKSNPVLLSVVIPGTAPDHDYGTLTPTDRGG